MQDEIQKQHLGLIRKLIAKLLEAGSVSIRRTLDFVKRVTSKDKSVNDKGNKVKDTKALMKRNRGQGIYRASGLSPELAKELGKQLAKHNQDYVKSVNKDGTVDIVVTVGNKSLIDDLLPNCNKNIQNRAAKATGRAANRAKIVKTVDRKLTNALNRAKLAVNKINKRHQDRAFPSKHKDVGSI